MLTVSEISKSYGQKQVLKEISFEMETGEVIALLGPSGCGKTTLLRIVAGLEQADSGKIVLDGQDLTAVPVYQRGFGMVFQDYALFPHKTAEENIAFGLRMAGWTAERQQERVEQLLDLVGLSDMGQRSVFDLSGGEQQRVALARALAPNPRLLLLDEPLGALDRALRERLMVELRSILARAANDSAAGQPVTTIYVTHDQEEAFAVAGRIMVMNEGRIEQAGTPLDLYRRPGTPFVARFLGMDNLFAGEVVGERPCLVQTAVGLIKVAEGGEAGIGSKGMLLIRPEAAEVLVTGETGNNEIIGRVREISFRGRYQIAKVEVVKDGRSSSLNFTFDIEQPLPETGNIIRLELQLQKCLFYPSNSS